MVGVVVRYEKKSSLPGFARCGIVLKRMLERTRVEAEKVVFVRCDEVLC